MDIKIINKEELKIIEDFINKVKRNERIRKPRYVCEKVIELTGNPYDYPCWNCSRRKCNRLMQRCSHARFGARIGNKYSPLFEMTGLEILEKIKGEIKEELKK